MSALWDLSTIYRVGPKSKPLAIYEYILLNRIKGTNRVEIKTYE